MTVWLGEELHGLFLLVNGPRKDARGDVNPGSVILGKWNFPGEDPKFTSTKPKWDKLSAWRPGEDGQAILAHFVRYAADPSPMLDYLMEHAPEEMARAVAARPVG